LNLGDVHYYNYQIDSWNPKNYPIARFLSETGVESMPSMRTWQQSTNYTEDFNYTSTFVVNRDHHPDGQHQMMYVTSFYTILFF
jgi:beta-mannosidase